MLNVKWLQALRAVVNARTVTEAADLLCITQPAVSRMIGHLEAELGFALFSRRGGRLTITPQGEAFYLEAERTLAGLDGLAQIGRNIQQGGGNHLRIFAMSPLVGVVIPTALTNFMMEYPTISVSLDIRSRRDVEQRAPGSQFEVGFVLLPVDYLGGNAQPLVRAPVVVVMPAAHPLAAGKSVALTALAREQLILMPPTSLLRRWIDGKFAELGQAPSVRIESSTMASSCTLAAKGLGVTIADAFTMNSVNHDGLAIRPLDPPLSVTFGYILLTERPLPLVQRLVELVRQAAEDVLASTDFLATPAASPRTRTRSRARVRHAAGS